MFELLRSSPPRLILAVLVLGGLSFVAAGRLPEPAAVEPPPPAKVKLAVLVVFDQLRGDYLERWQDYFVEGGFRRLMHDGVWFDNCHYPYAITKTAAGHASFLTGCSPARHGVIDNDWYDRREGKLVYCVESQRYQRVPVRAKALGAAPDRLLVPSVSDVLKKTRQGRVVALSLKDRSAVLPGGKAPDACYWFDAIGGEFVTSTYYRDAPHAWVTKFTRSDYAERWRGATWKPLIPDLDLKKLDLFPDPDADEGDFVHVLPGKLDPRYYAKLSASPFGNELLLEFAKQAVAAHRLGQDDVPDLLSISFSSNDLIGHLYGPDSPEVMDVTVRSDRLMADLLAFLDRTVGKGQYVLAVSADHGVCPLPEVSKLRGKEAARISLRELTTAAGEFLDEKFGEPRRPANWFESIDESWLYLNRQLLRSRGLELDVVAEAAARWLEKQPGLQRALTRQQLFGEDAADDPTARAVRRSYHAERAGDIVLVQKPLYLFSAAFTTGTTHGTPHSYDTHVPLLVYGPGIGGGRRGERVTPQAIAPIFAHFLGVPPPPACDTNLPAGIPRP